MIFSFWGSGGGFQNENRRSFDVDGFSHHIEDPPVCYRLPYLDRGYCIGKCGLYGAV